VEKGQKAADGPAGMGRISRRKKGLGLEAAGATQSITSTNGAAISVSALTQTTEKTLCLGRLSPPHSPHHFCGFLLLDYIKIGFCISYFVHRCGNSFISSPSSTPG